MTKTTYLKIDRDPKGCQVNASDGLNAGLGTAWVAPGEGSTWRELGLAFLPLTGRLGIPLLSLNHVNERTNLLLTGLPLQEADRERWESGNVEG